MQKRSRKIKKGQKKAKEEADKENVMIDVEREGGKKGKPLKLVKQHEQKSIYCLLYCSRERTPGSETDRPGRPREGDHPLHKGTEKESQLRFCQ